MINLEVIIALLVGLVIFLFGMQNFGSEIKRIAGDKFSKFLKKATSNRFFATLSGFGITALLQSSTATTIITVSLINAGFISFAQSLGIIFGSNIGSTITGQLVALKLTAFAPFLVIIGFFMSFFGKSYKYFGKGLFYFGLVFFGLTLMSNAIIPLQNNPEIIELFSKLSNIFLAILAGFIFTVITNSSAVTIGIVIVLSSAGLISLGQGIPILLGANLGTTLTTLIVSYRLNLYAKRTAIAHLMFNILGVLLILPFISIYANFISYLGGSTEQQIANAHTIFNVLAAFVFLIFLNPFRRIVESIVPGKEEEILLRTKYLSEKIPESNKKAFLEIEKELSYLMEIDYKMFEISKGLLKNQREIEIDRLERFGVLSNTLSISIGEYLYKFSQRKLNSKEAKKVLYLVRISNALEQLGDIAEDLGILPKSMIEKNLTISKKSLKGLMQIYSKFINSFNELKEKFSKKEVIFGKKRTERNKIEPLINKNYSSYIEVLKKEKYYSGSLFVEAISILENSISKLREIIVLNNSYTKII